MSLNFSKKLKEKKEKRLQDYRESLAARTGIYFSPDLTSEKEGFPYLKYIINALILFGATFGSMDCIISAFELDLNIQPLVFTCIMASLIFSFMYAWNKAKIITYLFVFFGIVTGSMRFYTVINSGILSLRNNVLRYIDNHADLPFLREYGTRYDDEFISMSIAVCVLAVALMILINIVVSEKMSLRGLFFLTFPIVQSGMYFNFKTSAPAMLFVVSSWILVAIVSMGNSYNGLTRRMVSDSSVKKHKHSYGFVTDSKNVAETAVIWLIFIFTLTAFVFNVVPQDEFEVNLPTNSIKTSTERVVKNALSYGFSSMYSISKDSAAPGQLSNISQVSFDGKTDYIVSLVNYRADRVYLRNYIGYDYNSEELKWECDSLDNENIKDYYNYTADLLSYDFNHDKEYSQSKHRMTVETVDSSLFAFPLNVPYYSSLDDDFRFESQGCVSSPERAESREYTFYTLDSNKTNYDSLIENIKDEEIKTHFSELNEKIKNDAYTNAMYVPERNIETMEKFCKTYGISENDSNKIRKVVKALQDDFTYTLQPGKIPFGEDYINYFLLASQQGYCQHFASSAVLIFRYLGIPARYAEGYAIDYDAFYTSPSLKGENYLDWIDTPYKTDMEVSNINVPDSWGHAWVEIYIDTLGWVPIEVTNALSDDNGRGLLSAIFGGASTLTSSSQRLMERVKNINAESTKQNLINMIIIAVTGAVPVYLIRMSYIVIRRRKGWKTDKIPVGICARYSSLYEIYQFASGEKNQMSYREFSDLLHNKYFCCEEDFGEKLEKAIFSGNNITEGEKEYIINTFKAANKEIIKEMKLSKKLSFYLIKILW